MNRLNGPGGARMRGSIVGQVNALLNEVSAIGESKHQAKEDIREQLSTSNVSATWHAVGKEMGIHSYNTRNHYFAVWREVLEYAKENFGVKDALLITNEQINAYMQDKINSGIKYSTFQYIAAAIEKLEVAINKFIKDHNQTEKYAIVQYDLSAIRQQAQRALERTHSDRTYENPKALVNAIQNPIHKLIAQAQLEGGFRIREINHLRLSQFSDEHKSILVQGKGGYKREIPLSESTYNALRNIVKSQPNQKLTIDDNQYRRSLKESAKTTNQSYTGSHGLRWNFAQNRMMYYLKQGYSYEASKQKTSYDMGHHRRYITDLYLALKK